MKTPLDVLDLPLHAGLDVNLALTGEAKVRFKTIRNNKSKVLLLVAHHIGDDAMQDQLRDVVIAAVNNWITGPNVRGSDLVTSQKAAKIPTTMSDMREQAFNYFLQYGAMTDEQLHEKFVVGEVNVTPDRVRHLRLELQKMEMIERCTDLVGKTDRGSECSVFRVVKHLIPKGATQ